MNNTNSSIQTKSILAPYIVEFLDIKRAQGFKYSNEEKALKSFDAFCCERNLLIVNDVTASFIRQWLEWRHHYSKNYTYLIRQLLVFMKISKGVAVAIPDYRFKEARPEFQVVYRSVFASLLETFISDNVTRGFKYESERKILRYFDLLCIEAKLKEPILTREIVQKWSIQRPTEGSSYRAKRVSIIRQFALFLISRGRQAYIAPVFPSALPTKPHIFRDEELLAFFRCSERYEAKSSLVRLTLPVIFRFYHCLGLRLSEATELRCGDLDLESGRMNIRMAKYLKDRVVYLPKDLLAVSKNYDLEVSNRVPKRDFFFIKNILGTQFSRSALIFYFKKIWQMTGYANLVDKKPTIHSFRHTLVVRKLEQWYRQKENYGNLLPYLSAFLGHSSLEKTYYYVHLVDSAFPIIRDSSRCFEHLFPKEAD